MTVAKAMELKSGKTTAQIEAEARDMCGLVDVQLPLTLEGWNLTEMIRYYGARPVVVRSADGDVFIGEVNEVDEEKYVLTVDLS